MVCDDVPQGLPVAVSGAGRPFRIAEARDSVCDSLRRADSNSTFDLTGARLPVGEAIV